MFQGCYLAETGLGLRPAGVVILLLARFLTRRLDLWRANRNLSAGSIFCTGQTKCAAGGEDGGATCLGQIIRTLIRARQAASPTQRKPAAWSISITSPLDSRSRRNASTSASLMGKPAAASCFFTSAGVIGMNRPDDVLARRNTSRHDSRTERNCATVLVGVIGDALVIMAVLHRLEKHLRRVAHCAPHTGAGQVPKRCHSWS